MAILPACTNGVGQNKPSADSSAIIPPKPGLQLKNSEGSLGQNSSQIRVGEVVSFVAGKFCAADRIDTAYVIKTAQGYGNAAEDGKPDEYAIKLTGNIKVINIGCCDARLINEGDLNNDGKEELSVFQYPENGNTCRFRTYTFGQKWTEMFEPFLVPAAGEPVTDAELQGKVVNDSGVVYYYDLVNSGDSFVSVKTKAVLR